MVSAVSGKISEIIFAHFEPHEDLRQGLIKIIKEKDVKSGVVFSITGALERATLQHFKRVGDPSIQIGTIDIPGPLEASGHGIIGQVEAPAFGKNAFDLGKVGSHFVHGEPYMHVHITVTSANQTVCGHLLDGCTVRSLHSVSHFTIVLGKIEGAMVQMLGEPGPEPGSFRVGHHLVQF